MKTEFECFKYGVKLYESILQLSMNIKHKEPHDEIQITMKNLNSPISYSIIFEERFKCFERKCNGIRYIVKCSTQKGLKYFKAIRIFAINKLVYFIFYSNIIGLLYTLLFLHLIDLGI